MAGNAELAEEVDEDPDFPFSANEGFAEPPQLLIYAATVTGKASWRRLCRPGWMLDPAVLFPVATL
jgi:hypothetical protein